jgi:ABC-type nitrate/sulfonate/bicarbonate transport system permease component
MPAGAGWRDLSAALTKRPMILYPSSFILGLILWEVIAGSLPNIVFASPSAVFGHIVEATISGDLPSRFANSLQHMVAGLALALVVAIPVGFLMGRNETARQMFDPVVNAVFSIPSVAWVPFLIIWFGVFFEGRVALVFTMCVFDIIVTISAGARNIEPRYVQVAQSFAADRRTMFFKVLMPASYPFLLTAVRIGTVRAVNAMITAELFFATVNLGEYMEEAASRFDAPAMLAVVFLLALFGLACQEGIKWAEGRLLPWHVRD